MLQGCMAFFCVVYTQKQTSGLKCVTILNTLGHTLDFVCSTGLSMHHLPCLKLNISDHLAVRVDIGIPTSIPKD